MKPVNQKFLRANDHAYPPEEWGDCFRACLASILELPLELVPNLHDPDLYDKPGEWVKPWKDWLWQEFRLRLRWCDPDKEREGWYGIGTFSVQNAEHLHHAVVDGKGYVLHDPYPVDGSEDKLGQLLEVAILVPVTLDIGDA